MNNKQTRLTDTDRSIYLWVQCKSMNNKQTRLTDTDRSIYLWVDVEVVGLLKSLAFRFRIVEKKTLLHNEEPVCVHVFEVQLQHFCRKGAYTKNHNIVVG